MAASIKKNLSIKVHKNDKIVSQNVCEFVNEIADKSIAERGIFTVGVSGGSVANFLCDGLPSAKTDWSKWRIFFCDERHVSYDDPECTYKVYKERLMTKVPLPETSIFPDSPLLSVEDAAKAYESKLREVFSGSLPRFDLLLLGMGPDGHTCSLFPGHALLKEETRWVAPISDSPKPPPQRITLTYPVLNNAQNVVFVSCGSGKADMVKRVLEGNESPPLPAARVQPTAGQLYWYLDEGAARLLENK